MNRIPLSLAIRRIVACGLLLAGFSLPLAAWAVDTDGDGVDDSADAFPNNAEAITDTDGDGKPDAIDYSKAPVVFSDVFDGTVFQAGWTQSNWSVAGGYAAGKSGSLQRTFNALGGGELRFSHQRNVSGTGGGMTVDGAGSIPVFNSSAWQQATVSLGAGSHTVAWTPTCSMGLQCISLGYYARLDNVTLKASALLADDDDDNDGVLDASDALPLDPTETVDTDKDGTGNNADTDDDNDAVLDGVDNCPLSANFQQNDDDQDGIGNPCDVDGPGRLISAFPAGSGFDGNVSSIALREDGRVLVGGSFTAVNGIARRFIARVDSEGSLDASFNSGSDTDGSVITVLPLEAGKVVVAGYFNLINGVSRNKVAILDDNGGVDSGFNSALTGVFSIPAVVKQADGKLLVGGQFSNARGLLARLNADGSLDGSFNAGDLNINSSVSVLVLDGSGKVLVGGDFMEINGVPVNGIARLNSNGSVDTSFNPGTGIGVTSVDGSKRVTAIAVQGDGKILIAGQFSEVNGIARNAVARLNPDGSVDVGFNPGTPGFCSSFLAMALQGDGKVLLGGSYGAANGVPYSCLVRLDSNGLVDEDFSPSGVANGSVYAIALTDSGRAMLGGSFTDFSGITRNRIAMIYTGDADQDGMEDAADYFSANAAAAADTDKDGLPDAWLQPNTVGCAQGAVSCNGLVLDLDDDNDGVPDTIDAAPLDSANTGELILPMQGSFRGSALSETQAVP